MDPSGGILRPVSFVQLRAQSRSSQWKNSTKTFWFYSCLPTTWQASDLTYLYLCKIGLILPSLMCVEIFLLSVQLKIHRALKRITAKGLSTSTIKGDALLTHGNWVQFPFTAA